MPHYRSLSITVTNNTGQDFNPISTSLQHGEWVDTPPSSIDNNTSSNPPFYSQSKNMALIGVTGTINMTGASTQGAFNINFNKPYGQGQTSIDVSCPAGYNYTMSGDAQGHDSSVTILFFQINN